MEAPSTSSSSSSSDSLFHNLSVRWQTLLDRLTPFTKSRWITTGALLFAFMLRVVLAQGWYLVAYALGIYLLNLLIAFLQPKIDPALEQEEEDEEGPTLPTKADEEFRPFIRRLPEFKFWYWSTRAILVATFCSCFEAFNVPVLWPILLMYFILLFVVTMRRQIQHMIKYRYVPWNVGKKNFRQNERESD
ncbi:uncharacterized protein VTP21DRAFT_1496 [Calcarisporiella thermophila]|uniref:uncharacterized protein n=1 Tax=Calcarisporiella thermophila TaxID=911321 RepID=UPI00374446C1